jgi:hypothetical protein
MRIFEAWLGLIHQPYGWVGALGATVCVIAVTIYWGFGGNDTAITSLPTALRLAGHRT